MTDRRAVTLRVRTGLSAIEDFSLLSLVRELLVEPYVIEREWDYGASGQYYACWTVLEHQPSETGIGYCEEGFGPAYPWGVVFLRGPHMSLGMDSAWFATLENAVRASKAWVDLDFEGYDVS